MQSFSIKNAISQTSQNSIPIKCLMNNIFNYYLHIWHVMPFIYTACKTFNNTFNYVIYLFFISGNRFTCNFILFFSEKLFIYLFGHIRQHSQVPEIQAWIFFPLITLLKNCGKICPTQSSCCTLCPQYLFILMKSVTCDHLPSVPSTIPCLW